MTDLTKLREALDKMIAGYSYDAFERNGNNYPPARAAVESLFAGLTRERDEALTNVKVAELGERNAREALAQARRAVPPSWSVEEDEKNNRVHFTIGVQRFEIAWYPDGGDYEERRPWMASMLRKALGNLAAAPQPPAQEGTE